MIVEKTFETTILMYKWISNKNNIAELKNKYPPKKYKADLNLIKKQVEVTER